MGQLDFLLEFLRKHPGRKFTPEQLRHKMEEAHLRKFGEPFNDVNKAARTLARRGQIQREPANKAKFYWYDPNLESTVEEFDEDEKREILERDGFACAVCKLGPADGVQVSVGYALSTRRGGKLDVKNGRTLCAMHRWTLETAQESDEAQRNWRKLRKKLPVIGSPQSQSFWNEFVQLLKKYGIDPAE
jgi:hypothetical protein